MKNHLNEACNISGTHELIRDLGRNAQGASGAATAEQHLMSLASDPLLVRNFVQGGLQEAASVPAPLSFHGWTISSLSRSATSGGRKSGSICSTRLEQYGTTAPMIGESIFPSAFEATAEDRREALDLHSQEEAGKQVERGGYRLFLAAIICTSFTIFLMLLLIPI